MVRLLLIGIGGYGENYIKEVLENDIPDVSLVGIADPFFEKSQFKDKIDQLGISVYQTPEEFFASGKKADLSVISSPIHTHYSYILTCLSHGSNVLVEKPVSISMELMGKLIEAEEKSGLFVSVGYQLCFAKDVIELKRRAISGEFGKPVRMKALRLMRRGDKYYSRTSWAGKLTKDGECVFDSPVSNACAHQLQLMLFMLGHELDGTGVVSSVESTLHKARPDIENFDAAAMEIKTEEDASLYFYAAHCLDEKKVGPYVELEYEKARVISENDDFKIVFNDGRVEDLSGMDKGKRLQKLYDSLDAVKSGKRPIVTLKTSLMHIKAVILNQQNPVYLRHDAKRKTTEDGDAYYAIDGLRDEFLSLYREWRIK